jgi:transcription elongation factor Elf1
MSEEKMKKKNKQQKVEKKPNIYNKIDECPGCRADKMGKDFATGELFCLKCGLVII